MRSPGDRSGRVLALGLTLLAFGLFLYGSDAKSIWWDESLSLHRAMQDVPYILSNRLDIGATLTIDQHPPLYFLLLHGVIRVFGESDLALRFPSVLGATLCVPLLYALGKRLAGIRVGLLAALFAALSPFYLWYAQEARMYALVTAVGAAGTYCLWRAVEERRAAWAATYAVTAAIGVGTLYFYALLVGVQLLFGLALLGTRSTWRPRDMPFWGRLALAALLLTLGGLLAWLAPPLIRTFLSEPLPGRNYVPLGAMLLDALSSFSLGTSVGFHEVWPAQLLYLAPYLLGVAQVWRTGAAAGAAQGGRRLAWAAPLVLLLGFPLLPLLFFWAVSLYKPIYMGTRYVIHTSPSFYLALAWGVDALWRRSKVGALALTLLLAGGMVYSDVRYHTHPAYGKEDYRGAARLVLEQELPGDAIVLTAPENIFAFEHYYTGVLTVSPLPQPPFAKVAMAELDRALRLLARDHDRIWFVHCRPQWSDPHDAVLNWLNENLLLLQHTILPSYGADMTVYLYGTRPPSQPEAPPTPPLATCSEQLALLDWSIRYLDAQGSPVLWRGTAHQDSPPEPAAPAGGAIGVRLRWRVLAPLEGIKLSLRLVDQDGQVWAKRDDRPIYHWPTQEWEVNTTVEHDAWLTTPVGAPPGRYRLVLVPYAEEDAAPLHCSPTDEGAVGVPLGEIALGATPDRLLPSPRELVPAEHRLGWPPRALGPLRLMGQALSAPSEDVTAGDTLRLHLWWLAQAPSYGEHDLVIHWVQGRTVAHRQVLALPGGPLEPGDPLQTMVLLETPTDLAPGNYRLRLLLYDRRAGSFARVRLGALPWFTGSLPLGTVTLAR